MSECMADVDVVVVGSTAVVSRCACAGIQEVMER